MEKISKPFTIDCYLRASRVDAQYQQNKSIFLSKCLPHFLPLLSQF